MLGAADININDSFLIFVLCIVGSHHLLFSAYYQNSHRHVRVFTEGVVVILFGQARSHTRRSSCTDSRADAVFLL